MKKLSKIVLYLLLTATVLSCGGLKSVPEGDLLYIGAKISIEKKDDKTQTKISEDYLSSLIRPLPNKSLLGIRPELFFYNLAGEVKKEKGWRYWLKYKLGKKPVLFSSVNLEYNKEVLKSYIENEGFFNVEIMADSTKRGKKATADFVVKLYDQYRIKSVTFPKDSTILSQKMNEAPKNSLLETGKPYSLTTIKAERSRIDLELKENGFYFFNEDYLKIQVDSTVGTHQVDLIVKIKRDTPAKAKMPYKINAITIYPNFKINKDTLKTTIQKAIHYKDFTIIDSQNLFKPLVFDTNLNFKKNDLYNRTNHNLSLNRLISTGNFKFVKNDFVPSDTIGNYLDANYYLTPLPKKSIRLETLAKTNSANYSGTEVNLNWSNHNTFRGTELLTIAAFGGFEVQVSGQNNGYNVFRYGGEASLVWPRFIAPFNLKSATGYVPKTKVLLNYEYQLRTKLYGLQTFNSKFGYLWNENKRKEHTFNILDLTYTFSNNISDLYQTQIVQNPSLERIIQKQLIIGPTYSYTFTNTMYENKKHSFYFKGSLDFSGNITGLLTGANDPTNPKTILDVPFSQFVKAEADFRHYLSLGGERKIASRVVVGAGVPYGNSSELPFVKQFFIGGTNSIRAFRARSIGPGTFNGNTTTSTFLPDQSGDLKFEFSTEFRGKIYDFIKGAVFVDGGNIWLLNENAEKPGAKFSSNFLNELAVGAGLGLRFDFSFLVLRTDFAIPFRKPHLTSGNQWVIDQINFGNANWRNENLIFNLAIGYPF